jgi:hypothetical protein
MPGRNFTGMPERNAGGGNAGNGHEVGAKLEAGWGMSGEDTLLARIVKLQLKLRGTHAKD